MFSLALLISFCRETKSTIVRIVKITTTMNRMMTTLKGQPTGAHGSENLPLGYALLIYQSRNFGFLRDNLEGLQRGKSLIECGQTFDDFICFLQH